MVFGIGTDIIEIRRVEQALRRTGRLKQKIFTAREIEYCELRGKSAQHFAARFAAKEAFLKALGTGWQGGHRFDEIEVINDQRGKPEAVVHGKVKAFCEEKGISRFQVSLSHIKERALAVVVLEKT